MKTARRVVLIVLLIGIVAAWLTFVGIERLYREDEDYTQIEPGLFVGGYTSAAPPGTTAVLNLCEFEDAYECDVHAWKPIRDAGPAPKIEWLAEQVEFIETQRNEGRTVYIHCFAGVSRSGMVAAAYLMRKHGWTRDEALTRIREERPQIRPNPAFMELLAEWQKRTLADSAESP